MRSWACCWTSHRGKLGAVIIASVFLLWPLQAGAQDAFDWRDINGADFTTPIRYQGSVGSCWAFAAVGALEAKLEITADDPSWNPNYSEQHLICDGTCGSANGGWEYRALGFFESTGVVTEQELLYRASDTSPDWPLAPGWENRVAKIEHYAKVSTDSIDQIKQALTDCGPLTVAIDTQCDWYWPETPVGAPGGSDPLGEAVSFATGAEDMTDGINHALVVVGYQDDPGLAEGGYWILKNSWGPGWGHSGYGYTLYGVLQSHNRVYAIDGAAFVMPEPATGMLLAFASWVAMGRRRRRL